MSANVGGAGVATTTAIFSKQRKRKWKIPSAYVPFYSENCTRYSWLFIVLNTNFFISFTEYIIYNIKWDAQMKIEFTPISLRLYHAYFITPLLLFSEMDTKSN